jgi:hypothetical protein
MSIPCAAESIDMGNITSEATRPPDPEPPAVMRLLATGVPLELLLDLAAAPLGSDGESSLGPEWAVSG